MIKKMDYGLGGMRMEPEGIGMKLRHSIYSGCWVLLLSITSLAGAQQDAGESHPLLAAYDRAATIQAYVEDKWVLNQSVHPRWIDETSFWYERETAEGKQFMRVDAERARARPAFNHRTLARALARETDNEVEESDLPITGVDISQSAMTFSAFTKAWKFEKNRLTELEDGPANPAWLVSPDGKRAVYAKAHNLWLKDLESGEEKALTSDGEMYYAYGAVPNATGRPTVKPEAVWSPDSRYLLTAQTDDRQVKSLPVIDFAPADGSIRPRVIDYRQALPGDEHVTQFRMTVIDTDSGKQSRIHYPDLAAVRMNDTPVGGNRAWWSADSESVYFVDILRGEQEARVVRASRDSGIAHIVFTETTDTYLELGSNVYMPTSLVPLPESNEFVWYSEKSGWAHLYLHDADSGEEKRALTSGEWLVRDVIGVDAKNRELFVSIGERRDDVNPYYREIARVNLDSGDMTVLSSGDDDRFVYTQSDFSLLLLTIFGTDISKISGLSPTGAYYVETRMRPDRPNSTVLLNAGGEEVMVVEQAKVNGMPEGQRWPEPFAVKGADRTTDIRGVMFRPQDFDESKKYPVIDYIYGGPQVAHVPKSSFESGSIGFDAAASLAELGFVVVIMDGRGTTERSRAFHETSRGQIHTASNLEDHIAGIKQLAARHSYMDAERVGITGFSGGGYMTAHAMLKFPDFFDVGVSGAGNHDQRLFWHSWGERYQGMLEGDNYLEQANLTHAENLKGKLLFIHGMLDYGVHPGGLFQLTQALMDANKQFDLVLMPQAGHELPGYAMVRMWDYFVRHLAGLEPPVDFRAKSSGDYMKEKIMAMAAANQAGGAEAGWNVLFDGETVKGLRGYRMDGMPDSWEIVNGTLKTKPGTGHDLISTEVYKNFELELEWKVPPKGNSGIFYFATEEGDYIWQSAPEMQVLDDKGHTDGKNTLTSAGALYALIAPSESVVKPVGEFNSVRIKVLDRKVEHWLNGVKIVEYTYQSSEMWNLAKVSKFNSMPNFAKATEGHIGLQGDHGEIWYRNIRIRKL